MTVAGLLLFLYAPSLCGNVIFHYTTGVAIGICFSLIVLTYILQRRVSWSILLL
jgi:NEMP family